MRIVGLTAQELLVEAESLPVEERARLADSLLRTLNAPDAAIDARWAALARRRLDELKRGASTPVPGDEVFERVWSRFDA